MIQLENALKFNFEGVLKCYEAIFSGKLSDVSFKTNGRMMIISGELWSLSGFHQGWLQINADRIAAVGVGTFPGTPDLEVGLLAPGFVDVHSHGAAGANFADSMAAARQVIAMHRMRGTVAMIGSLVSASIPELLAQVAELEPLVRSGDLAGIHLEGPWLSAAQRGAHDVNKLLVPTPEDVADIVVKAPGLIKMVTISPELPLALEAIAQLSAAGVRVAIGHTAANYQQTVAAFEAGACGVTHLFNAMADLKKREPGVVLAALRSDAWLELIFDGHHVAPELASYICQQYPARVVLITDAMAATGLGDGEYSLGGLPVVVSDGLAQLKSSETIAGSTIFLADAVQRAVAGGVALADAVQMATWNPAQYLQLPDRGSLDVGAKAAFVELNEAGHLSQVLLFD